MFLNFDYEKPSVSLTILMFLLTVLVLPDRRFAVERVATRILFCCLTLDRFFGRHFFLEREQTLGGRFAMLGGCVGQLSEREVVNLPERYRVFP